MNFKPRKTKLKRSSRYYFLDCKISKKGNQVKKRKRQKETSEVDYENKEYIKCKSVFLMKT